MQINTFAKSCGVFVRRRTGDWIAPSWMAIVLQPPEAWPAAGA